MGCIQPLPHPFKNYLLMLRGGGGEAVRMTGWVTGQFSMVRSLFRISKHIHPQNLIQSLL